MTEQHESYRVASTDIAGLTNQLNQIFNLLSNRLDRLEGLRGATQFYGSEFEYPGQTVSGFLKASGAAADFSSVAFDDLGVSTLDIGESYLTITDSNSTVIHQLGDEI